MERVNADMLETALRGREAIWPDGFPRPPFPYSPGIRAGGWVFASAQMATDLVSGVAPDGRVNPQNPYLKDPVELQSWVLMRNLSEVFKAAGTDISDHAVRIQQWRVSDHPTLAELEAGNTWTGLSVSPYYRARNSYLAEPRPASTGMGVRRLLLAGGLIGVDMIAIHPDAGPGKHGVGVPEGVPSPLAGYSPAICNGDWVFLAGEIPTDWTGDWMSEHHMGERSSLAPEARVNPYFWYGSPIEVQTEYTLQKLERIAAVAGTSLDRCVKANVYISHPKEYEGMDRVWRQRFPKDPPARVVIPYMGLGGKGTRIEIDMILLANDSRLTRRTISSPAALQPLGHEPQAVQAGDFLFFSTQVAAGPDGVEPALLPHPELPFSVDAARLQVARMFDSMGLLCEAAGTSLRSLCQIKEFYKDLRAFPAVRAEWADRFGDEPPASTSVEVGGPLIAPDCQLLMDAIGYAPSGD
jgi:enamine deaminase RidA (YjgF/YER057c/UK114 family)